MIFTTCATKINAPHIIRAVPVEVSLLEAEIPLELLLSLKSFPLIINPIDMIIITPFIIKEDINSGDTTFPLKHITAC